MWREIVIDEDKSDLSDMDIIKLTQECYTHLKTPDSRRKLGLLLAFAIGVLSAEVYIKPAQRATQHLSEEMSQLAVVSTVVINGIFNAYFNVDAVKELFYLHDPVTDRLSVPPVDLFLTTVVSIASALCMAFLDLTDKSFTSIVKFTGQLINFSAQHFFGVMKVFKMGRTSQCCLRSGDEKIMQRKAHYIAKFDAALPHFSQSLYENPAKVKEYYDEKGILNTQQLAHEIMKMPSLSSFTVSSYWIKGAYGLSQMVGFLGQIIGNLGYYNANVNGFLIFFTTAWAWLSASTSIMPFYILAFIVTYDNIDRIFALLINLVTKFSQGQYQQIMDDLPYAIKRTPLFSLMIGLPLTALGFFSFYSALELMLEGIYGGNEDNPSQFAWIDYEQTLKPTYELLTKLVVVIFNIFPVPDLQNFLSSKLCYLLNRGNDRQILELLSVIQETGNRVARIPIHVFQAQQEAETIERQPRQSACHKIMNWLTCGFWNRQPADSLSINMSPANYSRL